MLKSGEKLGAFIVPTGVGASIGGYAGDASVWARKFSKITKLIVNPNVVNAGGFSGITEDMFYLEGYSLDSFFKGQIRLKPSCDNKIGIVFDKAIGQDVMNIHINTLNAVRTVYGVNVLAYETTEEEMGVEFYLDGNGISTGSVMNPETILKSAKNLLSKGCEVIAIVGLFKDPEGDNDEYSNGEGIDPVGGVEAILSHYISKELRVPCAHSPAFDDYTIQSYLVNPKAASEYITPTFLPCVLLGLSIAPMLTEDINDIGIENLDFLVMPYNSLGSTPVFEALKRGVKIYAIKENTTALNVTAEKLQLDEVKVFETYQDCYNFISSGKSLIP